MSEATTDSLIWASSSSFSTRCFSAVRTATRSDRYRVRSRSTRIGGGGTKLGRSICRSATLHNHTASSRSVFGRPGQMLDVLGVDQPGLEPGRLQQVERRLPVVAGRLHHHPGHPQLAQAGRPSPAATGSSSCRSRPPARVGSCPARPGTRTQHTNSALPISSAATRSMISSRSWSPPTPGTTSCDPGRTTARSPAGAARETAESSPRARRQH